MNLLTSLFGQVLTPTPRAPARGPARGLAALWPRLAAPGRTDEDRFLSESRDLADLEQRLRQLERHGLPPGRPLR